MEIYYAPAFERIYKKLDSNLQRNVRTTVSKIIDAYTVGEETPGLGIKQLRGTIWEARSGLKLRVVFVKAHKSITFVLAGSHDDVKNFLKRV